ncbi:MAG: PIG-L family deacetylase [Acidobacteriota bacterium]|nr:PIG-L family deacetylase [Acidobacteriota bacterium]
MSDKIFLENLESLAIKKSESVVEWGKTIIFAPHPDDESLGCGGAIALLRRFDLPVRVITMSDGTLSHPNSVKFPADKLRDLRETEMKNALEILGVAAHKITFLRYRDRSVPNKIAPDFASATATIKSILAFEKPRTILVPWRRDPHPDHRATWEIVRAAAESFGREMRIIEYPIWLWELAEEKDLPSEKEVGAWRLDIREVVGQKQSAINAHASQTTDLIDDDLHAFRLSPEVLKHFDTPFEIYLEEIK